MRRASMRRGSAVLLTILPLLSPAYGLPTYFGNEVAHSNVERAAVPEPAAGLPERSSSAYDPLANVDNEGPETWLPKQKRQTGGVNGGIPSVESSNGVSLGSSDSNTTPGLSVSAESVEPGAVTNIGTEGPNKWLLRPVGLKRDAKPEAEADVSDIRFSMSNAPPLETPTPGDLDLGPLPIAPPAAI
ncbi:MAG: hypothetical protein LQ341_001600 [Variospora aurantia]|nr:MAG: hypothetical protein LQ341_001600 [Variospora aurantia]